MLFTGSLDQLVRRMPALTAQPAAGVSNKYVHIPTVEVLKDILSLGWVITEYHPTYKPTGSHGITLHHPDYEFTVSGSNDKVRPLIVFYNSHDATSAFKFWGGVFRFICKNGLIIPLSEDVKTHYMKIRHIHYSFEKLRSTLDTTVKTVLASVQSAQSLREYDLSTEQLERYVKMAWLRREDTPELLLPTLINEVPASIVTALSTPIRPSDRGNNAWLKYNTVQEHLIEKGFVAPQVDLLTGKTTRNVFHRPIANMTRRLKVNGQLYQDMQNIICLN